MQSRSSFQTAKADITMNEFKKNFRIVTKYLGLITIIHNNLSFFLLFILWFKNGQPQWERKIS